MIRPGGALSPRCAGVLEAALAGRQAEVLSRLEGPLTGRRLLFVVSLDEGGVNRGFYDLLAHLRTHPNCLDRCVGSVLVDAPGDLYTKAAGRDLVLAANLAGCAFVGRPLVEGTGDLRNFTVQARNAGCSLEAAYHLATADLVERVLASSSIDHARQRLDALIDQICQARQGRPVSRTEKLVEGIAEYIDAHTEGEWLDLNNLSQQFGVTPQYISNVFKKYRDENIKDYIAKRKLAHAKELLATTELTVKEVAARLGYANEIGVIRLFRKYEGVTPGDYRLQHGPGAQG